MAAGRRAFDARQNGRPYDYDAYLDFINGAGEQEFRARDDDSMHAVALPTTKSSSGRGRKSKFKNGNMQRRGAVDLDELDVSVNDPVTRQARAQERYISVQGLSADAFALGEQALIGGSALDLAEDTSSEREQVQQQPQLDPSLGDNPQIRRWSGDVTGSGSDYRQVTPMSGDASKFMVAAAAAETRALVAQQREDLASGEGDFMRIQRAAEADRGTTSGESDRSEQGGDSSSTLVMPGDFRIGLPDGIEPMSRPPPYHASTADLPDDWRLGDEEDATASQGGESQRDSSGSTAASMWSEDSPRVSFRAADITEANGAVKDIVDAALASGRQRARAHQAGGGYNINQPLPPEAAAQAAGGYTEENLML